VPDPTQVSRRDLGTRFVTYFAVLASLRGILILRDGLQFPYRADKGFSVQFIFGILLFVVVIGVLDARLPWPHPRKRGVQS
jgi:hypothetical protein